MTKFDEALPEFKKDECAVSYMPEHGFSLFLANRSKTIHFVRHAEGTHNEANYAYGDDTPCTFSTEGSWQFMDARLTDKGIDQCISVRESSLDGVKPELIVVSPFTRTLQTAHIIFGGSEVPFLVHSLCQERWGKFTCDKKRTKAEIVADMAPVYEATGDSIDFDSFGFPTEEDSVWKETREPDDECTGRGIAMMQWLATRPEKEIAVVTHSSWLKHLFRAMGQTTAEKDKKSLHQLAANAEVRSITLACHRGFYPPGDWVGAGDGEVFVPEHPSFRKGKWAPTNDQLGDMHRKVRKSK